MSETKECFCETKQPGSGETGKQDQHSKCPCGCGSDHSCPMNIDSFAPPGTGKHGACPSFVDGNIYVPQNQSR